jgi:hypothetical protein
METPECLEAIRNMNEVVNKIKKGLNDNDSIYAKNSGYWKIVQTYAINILGLLIHSKTSEEEAQALKDYKNFYANYLMRLQEAKSEEQKTEDNIK